MINYQIMKNLKALIFLLFLAMGTSSCTENNIQDIEVDTTTSVPSSVVAEPVTKSWHSPHEKKPLLSREYRTKRHHTQTQKH